MVPRPRDPAPLEERIHALRCSEAGKRSHCWEMEADGGLEARQRQLIKNGGLDDEDALLLHSAKKADLSPNLLFSLSKRERERERKKGENPSLQKDPDEAILGWE